MRLSQPERLLEVAAQETRERIRRDTGKVSRQVLPFLIYLEENLFDPGLTVEGIKRATKTHNNAVPTLFHHELSLTPRLYITDCRLEAASRLLRRTELKIWQIAHLIGYSDPTAFTSAFRKWAGTAPSRFRRQHLESEHPESPAALWDSTTFLHRAARGDLDAQQARPFLRHLFQLYEPVTKDWPTALLEPPPVKALVDGQEYEAFTAEQIWRRIRDRPFDEQARIVRDFYCFRSPVLFDLLRQQSRIEGRKDRQRGIQLAELALESLEGSAETLRGDVYGRRAQAWAWIGNTRRLALDLMGAELAFQKAEAAWSTPRENIESLFGTEVAHLKAALRQFQRRFPEALELENQALRVFEARREVELRARALITRAQIQGYAGEVDAAIVDLRSAQSLISSQSEPFLALAISTSLANFHCVRADLLHAREQLEVAKNCCERVDHQVSIHQIEWIEGSIRYAEDDLSGALDRFQVARSGLLELEEPDHAAVIGLDLAIVQHELGHLNEAVCLASETIPIFEAFRVHREALAALQIVNEVVETGKVKLNRLHELRSYLRTMPIMDRSG